MTGMFGVRCDKAGCENIRFDGHFVPDEQPFAKNSENHPRWRPVSIGQPFFLASLNQFFV